MTHNHHTRSAYVCDYDITALIQELQWYVTNWRQRFTIPEEEDLFGLWIAHHLHHFEMVSVVGYYPQQYTSDVINALIHTPTYLVERLYNLVRTPQHATGVDVVLHRFRNTLWVVYLL